MDEDEDLNGADAEIQSMIGHQLRTMYDSILSEPIPDSIVNLLMKLDQVQAQQSNGNSESR